MPILPHFPKTLLLFIIKKVALAGNLLAAKLDLDFPVLATTPLASRQEGLGTG